MAKRKFRTDASLEAETATRDAVAPLLQQHGFTIDREDRTSRGSAVSQVLLARRGDGEPLKIHVRLCWRRNGRKRKEQSYSAAQLRARLIDQDFEKTIDFIADRERAAGNTHNLFVQDDRSGFAFAALVPSDQLPAIWRRQRELSAELIANGRSGGIRKNHAENGASPTIWLQDDRTPATHAVADVLWSWPGVINVLTLPRGETQTDFNDDTFDDLPLDQASLGRDAGDCFERVRSGFPRDPKVRAAVLARASGRCERQGCEERRDYPGFLDVHHILGVGRSDRVWSCVALCPNCHREAHFAPDRDAINAALQDFASRFNDPE